MIIQFLRNNAKLIQYLRVIIEFKSLSLATKTIAGIEAMSMMRKGRNRLYSEGTTIVGVVWAISDRSESCLNTPTGLLK